MYLYSSANYAYRIDDLPELLGPTNTFKSDSLISPESRIDRNSFILSDSNIALAPPITFIVLILLLQ